MKLQEMESRLEGKYDADFLVYSSKITQLEKDRIAHISLIQDHSSRITRLETGATVYEDNIQIFDARISKLEMDGLTDQRNIQSLNSTSPTLFNLFIHYVHAKPNNVRNYHVPKCFISILLHGPNQ